MPHATYRQVVEQMWSDGRIVEEEVASMTQLQKRLGITEQDAAEIEREVMGMTKAEALVEGLGTNTPAPPVPAEDPSGELTYSGTPTMSPGGGSTGSAAEDDIEGSLSGGRTLEGAGRTPESGFEGLAAGMRLGAGARYELIDKVGEGGMGSVWRAKDLSLDGRVVAMKRIRLLDEADRLMLERFEQERRAISELNHANVVTVHDAGQDDLGPYLVMEYVEGEPLDRLLKRDTLSEERAVAFFEGLCRGVVHAHKKGVIHRDIKPANVILDGEGTPKLLDFGLARGAAGLELSMTGYGMGTLDYAAPEQKRDAKSVDERADIYALGATFYELLTGLKPVPLLVAKVPGRWQGLVSRCCEPDPDDRYPSAGDLLVGLQEARHASSPEAMPELGEDEDDLRCPSASCGRKNSVEARHCKACGEGLFLDCPACSQEIRAGLRHCDRCGASVAAVHEARARLAAAAEALEATRLGVAQREAAAGLEVLEGVRLGGAKGALEELRGISKRAGGEEKKAARLLKKAEKLESTEEYEQALEKLREAANLYDTHRPKVSESEERYRPLILVRDGARKLGEALAAEEGKMYAAALELYREAAELDEAHADALQRAEAVLPLWIALAEPVWQCQQARQVLAKGKLDQAQQTLGSARKNVPSEAIENLDAGALPEDVEALQAAESKLQEHLTRLNGVLASQWDEADERVTAIIRALGRHKLETAGELLEGLGPWSRHDHRIHTQQLRLKERRRLRNHKVDKVRGRTQKPLDLILGAMWPGNYMILRRVLEEVDAQSTQARTLLRKLRLVRAAYLSGIALCSLYFMTY